MDDLNYLENNIPEDADDLTAYIILWLITLSKQKDIEIQWKLFAQDLKEKSRFFPNNPFIDRIKEYSEFAILEIPAGTMFYRARLYRHYSEFGQKQISDLKKLLQDMLSDEAISDDDMATEGGTTLFQAKLQAQLQTDTKVYEKYQREYSDIMKSGGPFWGYDQAGSDAPPSSIAKAGRANPQYISYLYMANDIDTAISELRTISGQPISVATIRIKQNLKIFNLDSNREHTDQYDFLNQYELQFMSKLFSTPCYGDETDYYPTQYICDFIRTLGFDGIKYNSSIHPEGYNIVLFDTSKDENGDHKTYDIIESKVYEAVVSVSARQIIPNEDSSGNSILDK